MEAVKTKSKVGKICRKKRNEVHSEIIEKENVSQCDLSMSLSLDKKDDCKKTVCMVEEVSQKKSSSFTNVNAENSAVNVLDKKEELVSSSSVIKCDLEILHSCTEETVPQSSKLSDSYNETISQKTQDNFEETCMSSLTLSPPETYCSPTFARLNEQLVSECQTTNSLHLVENLPSPTSMKLKIYPSLEGLHHDITSFQVLVRTLAKSFETKIVEINKKCLQDFIQVQDSIEKHELFDLLNKFERIRKESADSYKKLKNMESQLKRKKKNLWNTVTKKAIASGKCEDGNTVHTCLTYNVIELDKSVTTDIEGIFRELEDTFLSNISFNSYVNQLVRLQIEQYVYELLTNSVTFANKSTSSPLAAFILAMPPQGYSEEIDALKKYISILFHFQRQPFGDKNFINITRNILTNLVALLLRSGTIEDSLFLVNHVVRCPSGISSWAVSYVQLPLPPLWSEHKNENRQIFGCDYLDYCLVVLQMLLNPILHREDFLKYLKSASSVESSHFVILDSDGEEEEDELQFCNEWTETDIISLLDQIPFKRIFEHVLCISFKGTRYDVSRTTEEGMQKLFGFATFFIDVMYSGLKTYNFETYPLLIEMLGRIIRQTLGYVSDHWHNYKEANISLEYGFQAEYDRFFFHTMYNMVILQDVGTWEFLSYLPYYCVSPRMLWNLLWIFYSVCKESSEEAVYSAKDVDVQLKSDTVRLVLQEKLIAIGPAESLHLLRTFRTMALATEDDKEFVCFVTKEIFESSFVNDQLRAKVEKDGRVIISTIVEKHPFVVSFLIKEIVERDDSIGNWAVNLFKEVDLSHWIPEPFDIEKFSEWLLCGSLSSPKNQLTRLILKKLNWGSDEKGLVFLPMELHRQIGLLVVQAYAKYDGNANNWVVSKGIEQMLQFCATVIGQNYDADQSFVHWAWELLFSLKLHVLDQPNPPWVQIYDGNVDSYSFPDIYKDLWLHPLQKAFEDKQPAACFLTLVMTNISCSVKSLTKHGLEIISILVEQKQYAAAIHSLYHILPFFVKQVEILTSNSRFMLHVYDLIVADLTSLNIIGSPVVGAVLKNFAAMMKNQIFQLWNLTVEHANPLLKLWIELLVKLLMIDERRGLYQTLKGSDNQVYYLLDVIIQIGFIHTHTRNGLLEKMYDISKTVVSTYSSVHKRSIWSIVFGSSEKTFSILRANSLPGYPWFMFCIIFAETNQKENMDLWLTIQQELISDATLAPEVALKRASSTLKISCCDLLSLPIYRWCLQTIHTPVSHPILPLLLQQFFLYYFHGTTLNTGLLQCSSINRKFFCESSSMKMLSGIKDKLREASDFYSSCLKNSSTKLKVLHAEREKYFKQGRTWEEEIKLHEDDFEFYKELLLIFQAFSRWIDDPQLHKTNICLPALEPNFCIPRLELILKHDQRLWVELLHVDKIKEKLEMNNTLWHQNKTNLTSELASVINKPSTATERIIERFKHHRNPLPMPSLEPLKAPVGEVNDYLLSSWDVLVKNIEMDQKIICQEAQKFEALLNKVKELNATYQSLIPHEYSMLQDTVVQKKTCNRPAYGSQECAGAAVFHLSVKKIKKEERVSQRIEKNRLDYHILLNELSKPPPNELSSAAMRLDNFVRTFIKKARSSKGQNAQILRNMGVSLFYYQLELTEKAIASATNYAPSRQCFTSSIEVLGREFIEGQEDQCFHVAKTILRHPSVAGLASPFFNPNISSVSLFLSVYGDIAEYVKENSINAVVVLLSKIDLQKWLNDKQVSSFDRKKLFMKIGKSLMNCEMENTEFLPAYELFKKHFKIVLLYQFPEHYDDAIHFLLSGMESKSLNVDMWYEMFRCLGCVISTSEPSFQEEINAIRKFALNQQLTPDQQLFVFTLPLHLKQVIGTLDFLYQYFHEVHQSSQSKLYEIYKAYLKPLTVFLGMLSHCLMDLYSEEKVCSTKQLSSSINYLWEVLYAAFSLWIDPVVKKSRLVFPWDIHEEDDARMMFEMFTSCLRFHHEHLFGRNFQKGLLSHLWNYYVCMYVKPGLRNYSMVVCHSAVLTLPWHEFYPSADDIDKMCTVLQCEIPESREFLAEISMKIPWIDVVTSLTSTSPPDIIANTLCILGKLLIISGWELAVIKTNSHQRILKSLENLAWHYLFPEMVGELLDLYSSVSNAVTLLLPDSGNSPDVYVLEFLKTISGMVPSTSLHSTCAKKQSMFLNKHTAHLSSCVNENINNIKCQTEKFNMILPRLLKEVEIVVLNGIEPSKQINYAIPLVKEVLGFLNSITDPFLGDQALASVVTWLNTSRSSPLLLPCLNVACCSLICMEHMVSIIECCITARFEAKLLDPNEALEIWRLISSCFQIPPPRQEDFITASVKFNSHLTLFIYVLHRLPQASTVTNKIWLLKSIVNWNENSEPKENMESKLILLWDKILEIGLQLTAENEHQVVQNTFLQFCGTLSHLGEDKSQIGLLAAVGFGKPSTLSVNFRFLCRAVAAYIYLQMPEKGSLRLELHAPGFIVQEDGSLTPPTKEAGMSNMKLHSYAKALRAFENLRNLASSKSYAALKTQVDCAVDYCVNPNFCLVESRLLLKELALQVFPTQAYLYVLNTSN